MDRPYVAENDVQRARLQAVVDRSTDVDTARPMRENWTVGVGLWMFLPGDGASSTRRPAVHHARAYHIEVCG
jgi:hypothetical protein